MTITRHAAARLQQRAIPQLLIELLYRHGREAHQDGSTVIYFGEKARRKAQKELRDALQRFDRFCDGYLVESACTGAVITAGHRTRRVPRR